MQIIAVAATKGGTGKTTTAAALAQAATAAGKRVLAVDLDPQANFTLAIGADLDAPGSFELLHDADPLTLIQKTAQRIDVIAARPDLATERTKTASAFRLRDALEPIKKRYDFIFIDTPPQAGELPFNALQAATGLIIPLEADFYSLQGLYQLAEIVQQMQRTNQGLRVLGTILTRFDARPKINRHLQGMIADQGAEIGIPYLLAIRPGVAIREAQALQVSLYDYAPRSKPAQDYMTLFEKIRKRK